MGSLTNALSVVVCFALVQVVMAQDGCGAASEVACCGSPQCCGHCGCGACCEKVCQVVCEMKEVKKTVWVVECEEYCVPLPDCRNCPSCFPSRDEGCGSCCTGSPCAAVPPRCGPVRCKKKLVKKEITCQVPVYKCVVRYLCGNCCEQCEESVAPLPGQSNQTANLVPPPPSPRLN